MSNPVAAIAFLSGISKGIKDFASEVLSSGNCSSLMIADLPAVSCSFISNQDRQLKRHTHPARPSHPMQLHLSPHIAGQPPQLVAELKFAEDLVNGQIKKSAYDLMTVQAVSGLMTLSTLPYSPFLLLALNHVTTHSQNSTKPRKVLFVPLNEFVTRIVGEPLYARRWGLLNVTEPCMRTNSTDSVSVYICACAPWTECVKVSCMCACWPVSPLAASPQHLILIPCPLGLPPTGPPSYAPYTPSPSLL